MRKLLGVVIVGLAVVAAGCGSATLESGGPAKSVAVLPGGVDLAAGADTEYAFEGSLGYKTGSIDSFDGNWFADVDVDTSGIVLGFSWMFVGMPGAKVQNNEVPVELQTVAQMASSVSLAYTMGSFDPDVSGAKELDTTALNIGAKYVFADGTVKGLGFELTYGSETVEDVYDGLPWEGDVETTSFRFGALYYIAPVPGLIAKLGYSSASQDWNGQDYTATVKGLDLGVEYYKEIVKGQWLDAGLTLAFLTTDPDNGGDEDSVFAYTLDVTYFPLKFVGVGIVYGNGASFIEDEADSNAERSVFGINAVWNIEQVPGLDLNLGWDKATVKEAWGGDDEETSAISFRVDYRF